MSCTATDSEEELDGSHTSPEDSQDGDDEMEWKGSVPTDKAHAYQFVREQSGLNKEAVPHLDENSQPRDFFLFFELVFSIISEETNHFLKAVCWKDKMEVYILTNIHAPPAEGNFRNESGNPV
jgi:hypothetical protein